MKEKDFLLEILVQEMPYRFIPSAIEQLKTAFRALFDSNKLNFGSLEVYATPRRLAVLVSDLECKQEDTENTLKGPVLSIATDENGNYTQAALGFAKKNGAPQEALYQKDGYIWAKVKQAGKDAKELLEESVENIILKLQGAYFMRWGYSDVKFSRPIENVVALLGDEVLNLSVAGIKAGRKTLGHRYSKQKEVEITSQKSYLEQLEGANVIVDPKKRRERIVELASKKAAEVGAVVRFDGDEELLEEVTFITEFPTPVVCEFDKKYLQIPDIVTTTVMSKHQRYFPLYSKEGKLLNNFITMANFVGEDEESFENIKAGNQRVVCARLEDGIFFYKEDTKTPPEEKLEDLKGITFQKGLGSLYDKTQRIEALSGYICEELSLPCADVLRAARLLKCDLATSLVFEFTELQGFIGSDYARVSGEKENVALAVAEHYFPLGAYSELAQGIEGQITGIADKVDTICAVFLSTQKDKKRRPTGSTDPLGVRRAVLGVLRTVISGGLNINLSKLLKKALENISEAFNIELLPETLCELHNFFISRLVIMYEKDYRTDVLQACSKGALSDLVDFLERVKVLSEFVQREDFPFVYENATRVERLVKERPEAGVNESLFVLPQERELWDCVKGISKGSLEVLVSKLKELSTFVNAFFEKVLVMDKDESIKNNRLALLSVVCEKYSLLCDFSHITKG